jgi:hypothetical protein
MPTRTQEVEAFAQALADTIKLDYIANYGRLMKTAYKLWPRYTPNDLKSMLAYWITEDWRGVEGGYPNLSNIEELIRRAVEWDAGGRYLSSNRPGSVKLRKTTPDYSDIIES